MEPLKGGLWIFVMIHCSLLGCCWLRADGFPVKRLLTLNFSCECQTWSFSTFNLKMKLIPEARKTSHKQISLFFFRRKETHLGVFFSDAPAAMVMAPNLCATAAH